MRINLVPLAAFLFIASFLTESCRSKNETEAVILRMRQNIVGHQIQFLNTYEYLYKDGKVDSSTKFLSKSVEYNRSGFEVRSVNYKREIEYRNLNDSIVWQYNKDGRLTGLTNYHAGILQFSTKNKYKFNNQLIESIGYDHKGDTIFISRPVYKKGVMISEDYYDKNDNLQYKSEVTDKGHQNSEILTHGTNVFYKKVLKRVNDKGLLIEERHIYKDDKKIYKYTYNVWDLPATITRYDQKSRPVYFYKIEMVKWK